jgi:hypothetical protein
MKIYQGVVFQCSPRFCYNFNREDYQSSLRSSPTLKKGLFIDNNLILAKNRILYQ